MMIPPAMSVLPPPPHGARYSHGRVLRLKAISSSPRQASPRMPPAPALGSSFRSSPKLLAFSPSRSAATATTAAAAAAQGARGYGSSVRIEGETIGGARSGPAILPANSRSYTEDGPRTPQQRRGGCSMEASVPSVILTPQVKQAQPAAMLTQATAPSNPSGVRRSAWRGGRSVGAAAAAPPPVAVAPRPATVWRAVSADAGLQARRGDRGECGERGEGVERGERNGGGTTMTLAVAPADVLQERSSSVEAQRHSSPSPLTQARAQVVQLRGSPPASRGGSMCCSAERPPQMLPRAASPQAASPRVPSAQTASSTRGSSLLLTMPRRAPPQRPHVRRRSCSVSVEASSRSASMMLTTPTPAPPQTPHPLRRHCSASVDATMLGRGNSMEMNRTATSPDHCGVLPMGRARLAGSSITTVDASERHTGRAVRAMPSHSSPMLTYISNWRATPLTLSPPDSPIARKPNVARTRGMESPTMVPCHSLFGTGWASPRQQQQQGQLPRNMPVATPMASGIQAGTAAATTPQSPQLPPWPQPPQSPGSPRSPWSPTALRSPVGLKPPALTLAPAMLSGSSNLTRLITGACTMQGVKRCMPEHQNQDRHIILPLGNDFLFVGVFDGHGRDGHHSAARACSLFEQHAASLAATSRPQLPQTLSNLFQHVHATLESESLACFSGTTATVAVINVSSGAVTVAHVGDSTLAVVTDGHIEFATPEHRVDDALARIVCTRGGEVRTSTCYGVDARRVYKCGSMFPGLAMARSLGDREAQALGCSCVPEVNTCHLSAGSYLIVASDGLWDQFQQQEVVNYVTAAPSPETNAIAAMMVQESFKRWVHVTGGDADDITVVILKVLGERSTDMHATL
eukprot:NODE_427_length_3062_cov_8.351959.p1 GENE.NODE_427_length_3062_cov_8.351959~~NODE_427_length_3062_cov_8.351959.p1  ORF type:complete len:860 (+),score=170.64 NODE_427_length_3062_cov_8.351959:263-2842(+)